MTNNSSISLCMNELIVNCCGEDFYFKIALKIAPSLFSTLTPCKSCSNVCSNVCACVKYVLSKVVVQVHEIKLSSSLQNEAVTVHATESIQLTSTLFKSIGQSASGSR